MSSMSYVSSYFHCVFSTMTFQEEFLALLKKHHIAYDERYLWE